MPQSTNQFPSGHNVTFAHGVVMADARMATECLNRILGQFAKEKKLSTDDMFGADVQTRLQEAIQHLEPLCTEPTMTPSPARAG